MTAAWTLADGAQAKVGDAFLHVPTGSLCIIQKPMTRPEARVRHGDSHMADTRFWASLELDEFLDHQDVAAQDCVTFETARARGIVGDLCQDCGLSSDFHTMAGCAPGTDEWADVQVLVP